MSTENIVSLFPQAPEPLSADEIMQATNVLTTMVGDTRPMESLSQRPEVWALLVRMAETDPGALNRLELKMRVDMKAANVDAKDAEKFNFRPIRDEAKQNAKARAARAAQLQQRRRANERKTQVGRTDELAVATMEMPTEAQADNLSASPMLIARSWLSSNRRGRVWYDEFANNVFTNWDGGDADTKIETQPIDDRWRLNVYFTLQRSDTRLAKLGEKAAELATNHFAFDDTRNAPKDWLRGLVWDKQPRLATWISRVYGTPQDPYHAAVGRCWLVGMVARIHCKGDKMDNMPVLIGAEGTRKSTSLEILGGKLRQGQRERHYYGTINVSAEKMTDFLMTLNGLMVAEIAELDALMNKRTEHGRVKTIVTTTEDLFRAPYGRCPSVHRRSCVLAGTTNEFHWNNFEGIGRRFWPFEVTRVADTDWLIENRNQLFAEAQELYALGASWHYVPLEGHQEQIREHRIDDPQAERIATWLEDTRLYTGDTAVKATIGDPTAIENRECWGTLVTTNRLLIQALGLPFDKQGVAASRKVASIMRNLGWRRQSVRLGVGVDAPQKKAWVKYASQTSKQGQLFDNSDE